MYNSFITYLYSEEQFQEQFEEHQSSFLLQVGHRLLQCLLATHLTKYRQQSSAAPQHRCLASSPEKDLSVYFS